MPAQALSYGSNEGGEQMCVWPWKIVLRAVTETITYVRSSHARPYSNAPDEFIALKAYQMGPYGVVRNSQLVGKLINGSVPGLEQGQKPTASAFEKAITPARVFHTSV